MFACREQGLRFYVSPARLGNHELSTCMVDNYVDNLGMERLVASDVLLETMV
jgi:hypothetical protein